MLQLMQQRMDQKEVEKNGEKLGEQKGERKSKIEIAKKLLERKMTIKDLQKITLLSKDEIEELNKEQQQFIKFLYIGIK